MSLYRYTLDGKTVGWPVIYHLACKVSRVRGLNLEGWIDTVRRAGYKIKISKIKNVKHK